MECSFAERKQALLAECSVPEDLVEYDIKDLESFLEPFLQCLARREQKDHARTLVTGLCSDVAGKKCETIAYHFGQTRGGLQRFVGESRWSDEEMRAELVRQIAAKLGEPGGILVFDPSAFHKSGKHSVGVQRQWCGRLGKIDNCQVAVYLGYVSSKGHALVDCQLYLPKEWIADKARLRRAHVPRDRRRFRTRHQMCFELLNQHGATLPHEWITGDDEFGRAAGFRSTLRMRGEKYLFTVPCNTSIRELPVSDVEGSPPERPQKGRWQRVDEWVAQQPPEAWQTVDVRDGEKGPLIVEALQRCVETRGARRQAAAQETLVVIRYTDRDSRVVKVDYCLSNAPTGTSLATFCRVAKAEHRIEEVLQRGKSETGMGDYEVRTWIGWHHHQTLSLIAAWYLHDRTRAAQKKNAPPLRSHSSGPSSPPRFAVAPPVIPPRTSDNDRSVG